MGDERTPRDELVANYTRLRDDRRATLAAQKARDRALSFARVACLLGAAVGLGVSVWSPWPQVGSGLCVGGVLAFIALVVLHVRLDERVHRSEAAVAYFERGLFRIDVALSKLTRTGERHLSPKHPYADDLDLFGKDSLFTLLDSTETRFGEETLAAWLAAAPEGGAVATSNDVLRARQEAVKDAAKHDALREELSVVGSLIGEDKPDPRPFVKWVESDDHTPVPAPIAVLARVVPLVSVGLFVAGQLHAVPAWVFSISVIVGVAISRAFAEKTAKIVVAASTKQSGLRRFATLFQLLAKEPFEAARLVALQKELAQTGATASVEMDRLGRIIGFLDARENEVFRALIAPVFMWDLNCAISLATWANRARGAVGTWFRVLGEMEALFSLAAFSKEQAVVFPTLVDGATFEAEALGHPLIQPGKRVANDVGLAPALVVTGSNMSGKSTLLRTIGVNVVLARAGAPVCAKAMRIGPLTVATSLRVRDSLGDGVSRFYAELEKIKTVVATSKAHAPALFLLDEVLAGTNARERIAGAKSIVRALIDAGALGAVSTHDLELCKLEDETEGRVKNVHFQEQVNDDVMTFDYRLRPGVVTSSNALRLMRALGLPVGDA
jgi:hypothetical protein